MTRSRGRWPLAPDFHPEFGLLCPSARLSRTLRRVLLCLAAGVAVGATTVWAVPHLPAAKTEVPSIAASIAMPPATETAAPGRITRRIAAVPMLADADTSSGARAQATCKTLASSFLDPTCRPGKLRPRHAMHGKNRVATFMIGRASLSPEPTLPAARPSLAAAASERSRPATAAATKSPASTPSFERPAAPLKKKASASNAPAAQIAPKQDSGAAKAFAALPWPVRGGSGGIW